MTQFNTNQSFGHPFNHSVYDAAGNVVATLAMRRAPRGRTRDEVNGMAENDGIGMLARRIVAALAIVGDDKTHVLEKLVDDGVTLRQVVETLTESRQQLHALMASMYFMRITLKDEAEDGPATLEERMASAIEAIDHVAPEQNPQVMRMVELARLSVVESKAAVDQAASSAAEQDPPKDARP